MFFSTKLLALPILPVVLADHYGLADGDDAAADAAAVSGDTSSDYSTWYQDFGQFYDGSQDYGYQFTGSVTSTANYDALYLNVEMNDNGGQNVNADDYNANENIKEHIFSMLNTALTDIIKPIDYVLSDAPIAPARDYLYKYGCYCFPGAFDPAGPRFSYNGKPLDKIDSLCRDLYRSQKCLRWDSEDNDRSCDTTSDYSWWKDTDTEDVECGKWEDPSLTDEDNDQIDEILSNYSAGSYGSSSSSDLPGSQNECSQQNCNLEKIFIRRLMDLLDQGYEKNTKFHMFDKQYKQKCYMEDLGMNALAVKYNQCCGEGFQRKPYSDERFICIDDGNGEQLERYSI